MRIPEIEVKSGLRIGKTITGAVFQQAKLPLTTTADLPSVPVNLAKTCLGIVKKHVIPEPVLVYCKKEKFTPVAKSVVYNKVTGLPIDVYLVKSINPETNIVNIKYLALDVQGKNLGFTKIKTIAKENYKYGKEDALSNCNGYVYVDEMKSYAKDENIKGVGSRLHQLAVEKSILDGYEGRVGLQSVGDSFPFHYKSWFRAESPWYKATGDIWEELNEAEKQAHAQKIIEKLGDNIKKVTFKDGTYDYFYDLERRFEKTGKYPGGSHNMFLPEEHIEKLRDKSGRLEILDAANL